MKTSSDELFKLVKSLDPSEKRYFKIHIGIDNEARGIIQLFDIINAQEGDYDEEKVKKKLNDAVKIRNLKHTKSRLIEHIFKALRNYNSDTIDAQLCEYIQDIKILIEKRLFYLALKKVSKAECLANSYGEFRYLSIILSFRQTLLNATQNIKEMCAYPETHYQNELKCLALIKNQIDYGNLYVYTFGTANKYNPIEKNVEFYELLKGPLLQNETQALSVQSKIVFHHILGLIFKELKDYEKSYINMERCIWYQEKMPDSRTKNTNYLVSISNAMNSIVELKKGKEINQLYEKGIKFFNKLSARSQKAAFARLLALHYFYVSHQMFVFNMQLALKISEEIKMNVKKHAPPISFFTFRVNLFIIYFYLNNYRQCLKQINELLNIKEQHLFEDQLDQIKIINLIVHYELKNENLLPNFCKSTELYFDKRGKLGAKEKLLLTFFGKTILKLERNVEKINLFIELKNKLQPVLTKQDLDYFDYLSWIESKIENRSFLEICKQKAKV